MIRRAALALALAIFTTVLAGTDNHRLILPLFIFLFALLVCALISLGGSTSALFLRNEYVANSMKPCDKRSP